MDRRQELAFRVAEGTDGWLFLHEDQLCGIQAFTNHQVSSWRWLLERRHHWLRRRDVRYHFLIAPEKPVVYADKLGPDYPLSDFRPALQIMRKLRAHDSPVSAFYPVDVLTAVRPERDCYRVTDSHWNAHGDYAVYRHLCAAMSEHFAMKLVELEDLKLATIDHVGDLGVLLEPERSHPTVIFTLKEPKAKLVGGNHNFTRGALGVYENADRTLPRAVIFRDSFAMGIIPLLAQSFSRIVAVSAMEVLFDLVEAERPDVVITEVAERHLNPAPALGFPALPDDLAAPPFETFCKTDFDQLSAWRRPK